MLINLLKLLRLNGFREINLLTQNACNLVECNKNNGFIKKNNSKYLVYKFSNKIFIFFHSQ